MQKVEPATFVQQLCWYRRNHARHVDTFVGTQKFGCENATATTNRFTRIMEKFGVTGAKELRRLAITFNK
jgi:hypothetical protein